MKRIKKLSFLLLTLCAVFSLLTFSAAASENGFTLNPELILNPQTSLSVFVDGTADSALSGNYPYGEAVELNAPSVAGKTFLYWTNDEGTIISYSSTIKVKMYANTALSAAYGTAASTAQTTAAFLNVSRTDGEIIFNAIAKANGSITETGIRYSTTKSTLEELKGTDGVTVAKADDSAENWTLIVTPADEATTYYAVVYTTVGSETTYSAVKAVKLSELQSAVSTIINRGELKGVNLGLCNVTFNANGGEGAMLPQGMVKGTATALNENTFIRKFHSFSGWNTAADGTGEGYTDGQTVTLNENLTLYAQWTEHTQTITAENVTATYGDTGKSVSASVTEPATGGGALSYAVTSGDAVTVNSSTGALTIVKAGTAVVTVTAAETDFYAPATKEVTVSVATKGLTITGGLSAENKEYNGTTTATVTGTAVISGIVGNDNVSVSAGTAAFADKNVGTGKTVSFTGYGLSGSDAGNYHLTGQPADVTANITAKDVTITGLDAENKEYDGTTTAMVTGTAVISGKVGNDNVSVSAGTAAFADKNVGTGKTVSFNNYSLSGTDAGNYNLSAQPASVTADITAKAVTVTPDEKSTAYGKDTAELTFTVSGLVNENDKASLKVKLSTTATKTSPAGVYDITGEQEEGYNANYAVTFDQTRKYTINQADATITASAYSGTYDGQPHSISVSVTDPREGGLGALLDKVFGQPEKKEAVVYYSMVSAEDALTQKSTENPTFTDVGETTVYYAVEFGGNYTADPVTGSQTVAITPKEVGLKWSNTRFLYDGKSHLPKATVTGLVKGDKCTVTVSGKQSKAGTYTATAAKLSNANYKLPGKATQKFTIIETKKTNINNGLLLSEKGGVVTFSYGEVSDADSYVVYFRYCGTGSQKPLMTVKGAKNTTVKIKKFGGKKINRKRSYTLWVEAKKDGKVLKTSAEVHAAGSKNKGVTNAKSVKVKKSSVTLKKNKTSAIKATVKKAGKGKLHKSSKIPQIRYATSNKKVATVNKKGTIKAVGKGKCKIKVMALNGVCTYVTVTVK